ncbi:Na+-transporting malonate decarboxylase, carboxybiotin decarboxylase subunit [Rubneribacter badeniensis]|uniref:Na+-transporting malonate decarboxylase, carboxybiotin decarboxylase subunit n=1 Tax=Rubneribacter badeniensis TaxID=2070688 RepID=A0A2K2U6Z1_9ACTN|nr:Na+-transporting malonate decarboxylase, carboxybiotin decarboxylase subunit [Rubneribacter badeniensis]PNV66081.1 Na+-transporting malonate decarboxylase, carboxybiotin decarboxylase subunit [Rubneribacter badeniensis]
MDILMQIFPGIFTLFDDPLIGAVRVALILLGFVLAFYGFKGKLEPLIMVPMGLGMIAVNAGVLFLGDGSTGTLIIDPLVSETDDLMQAIQVNFLQPIYNFTFSNNLIACLVFMGIGARSELSFLLARPWTCIIIAIFAEMGTFATLSLGVNLFGLDPAQAASVATIGGADGPMVLFGTLMMSPDMFVSVSIIAYLYLSLTYAGYPYIIKALVPKKYRGLDVEFDMPQASSKSKFIFVVVVCLILCLLLPVAAPLMLSFFLGMAVKEAKILPYQELFEGVITSVSSMFLGLVLGTLCEASTILDPVVGIVLILGILALAISAVGGLAGGWIVYLFDKRRGKTFNPVVGIAGVSCVPTTTKLAQHAAEEENPFAIIIPIAMGCNIGGVIVSAIATGVFVATISLVL